MERGKATESGDSNDESEDEPLPVNTVGKEKVDMEEAAKKERENANALKSKTPKSFTDLTAKTTKTQPAQVASSSLKVTHKASGSSLNKVVLSKEVEAALSRIKF